jgi:hypothetical protein
LYVDRSSDLWIISNSGSLEKFNSKTQKFTSISSIYNASVIFQNKKKHYYIGTYGNGLYKIDHKTKDTLQVFQDQFKDLNTYDILEFNNSSYIASSTHLFKIMPQTLVHSRFPTTKQFGWAVLVMAYFINLKILIFLKNINTLI